MQEAANKNNGGVIDIYKKMEDTDDTEDEGRIAALFGESLYHNSIINDEDGIDERFECL